MDVNPNAWISTIPLTVFLVALYFQPADNVLKRWWSELSRFEADLWFRLSGSDPLESRTGLVARRACFWTLVVGLLAGSLLSLASFLEFPLL